MNDTDEQGSAVELAEMIAARFDKEELDMLCFRLGIEYDDLPSQGKRAKAYDLVDLLRRHNRIPELIEIGSELRPYVTWDKYSHLASMSVLEDDHAHITSLTNRKRLLEKVQYFWIDQVLHAALDNSPYLDISVVLRPDLVQQPWDSIVQRKYGTDKSDKRIFELFEEAHGELLILGKPGSGKTVALLKLAQKLLEEARANHRLPIPVVFNLASWAEDKKSIAEWLIDELYDKYQVPQKIGRNYVQNCGLLLLLDGLDEVLPAYQEACILAINQFRQDNDIVDVCICCRIGDYETAVNKLRLNLAIELTPLSLSQIGDYLPDNHLERIALSLINKDEDFQELLETPLMLKILTTVFEGTDENDLARQFQSEQERQTFLLNAYVQQMFRRRTEVERFPKERTLYLLNWLAKRLQELGQSIFLVEHIQPKWLPDAFYRKRYNFAVKIMTSLLITISFGVSVGVSAALIFSPDFSLVAGTVFGLAWGIGGWFMIDQAFTVVSILLVGSAFSFAWGVAGWQASSDRVIMIGAAILGFIVGIFGYGVGVRYLQNTKLGIHVNKIEPVEIIQWSWKKASSSLLLWLLIGIPIGLGIGIPVGLLDRAAVGWAYGLATMLSFVFSFGIAGGFTTGEIEATNKPNQGIRRSARNALQIGGTIGLIISLVFSISFGAIAGLRGSILGVFVGLAGWTVGWLFLGGFTVMQHFILRWLLSQFKVIPWHYVEFLDYATERAFLQKVGGGYMFIHKMLLEYFSALDVTLK